MGAVYTGMSLFHKCERFVDCPIPRWDGRCFSGGGGMGRLLAGVDAEVTLAVKNLFPYLIASRNYCSALFIWILLRHYSKPIGFKVII